MTNSHQITITLSPADATITLSLPLPPITDPVRLVGVNNAIIDGSSLSLGFGATGLHLMDHNGSVVSGLTLTGFAGPGLWAQGDHHVLAGLTVTSSGDDGIRVDGANASVTGCRVALNGGHGIAVLGPRAVVQGNWAGVDASGLGAAGNALAGIFCGGDDSLVGGASVGAGNVASGNGLQGLRVAADRVTVQGNLVGLDATGRAAVPNNGEAGISADGADLVLGGASVLARNVVSGNAVDGALLRGDRAVVLGNYFGLDMTGSQAVPNGNMGSRGLKVA